MVFREIIKVTGVFIIMLISISTYSQTASAVFQSNEAFQITINNILQQNTSKKSFIIDNLSGERTYVIQLSFINDTNSLTQNIYIIDEGLTHFYTVSKEAIQLQKVIPAVTYIKPESQLSIAFVENINFQNSAIKTDTLPKKDTAYVIPFENYYQLKDYEGRIGCPFPIPEEEIVKLRGLIISENLEDSKLEKVKLAIQDMDSICVLIASVKELTSLFEFEETRVNFINFIAPHVFDLDNYERLYPLFNYDTNKEELKRLFKSKD
jgi:hypothetical protein